MDLENQPNLRASENTRPIRIIEASLGALVTTVSLLAAWHEIKYNGYGSEGFLDNTKYLVVTLGGRGGIGTSFLLDGILNRKQYILPSPQQTEPH